MSEILISVDIEASGPIPGEFSMLSLGACVVGATEQRFYVELKPITRNFEPEAMSIAGFDLADLEKSGVEPKIAMLDFERWIANVTPPDHRPIFVAYPIAFDWMFVAYYFHRFLKRNPFGIAGLDVKSFYMGMTGKPYLASSKEGMEPQFTADLELTHNAVEDAIAQAKLFERMLAAKQREAKK
ncbi:MAG: 3'-5' exonuclease [Chloroflexi bacterium]|nr:3'-5' exonuclease [Chloroflexota bacterium]